MKNIKNIYKLLLILPFISMVSCDDSNNYSDVLTVGTTPASNTVFIETSDAYEDFQMVETNAPQTITVGVNNSLTSDVTVGFTVVKLDGGTAVIGVDYTLSDAVISANATNGTTQITFMTPGRYEVTIASASNGGLNVVHNKALYYAPPSVNFTLSWGDNWYDYDMLLLDGIDPTMSNIYSNGIGNLNLLAYSGNWSGDENFFVLPPLGLSYIYVEDYWNDFDPTVPVVLTVEVSGMAPQTFDIVMDQDKWVLEIDTQIGSDGNIVHTLTQL